jgi:hypothetical protein
MFSFGGGGSASSYLGPDDSNQAPPRPSLRALHAFLAFCGVVGDSSGITGRPAPPSKSWAPAAAPAGGPPRRPFCWGLQQPLDLGNFFLGHGPIQSVAFANHLFPFARTSRAPQMTRMTHVPTAACPQRPRRAVIPNMCVIRVIAAQS